MSGAAVNSAEVLRRLLAKGPGEREELKQALIEAGLDDRAAIKAVCNALARGVVVRQVDDEGHTTYALAGDGPPARAPGGGGKRGARRGKTKPPRRARKPAGPAKAAPAKAAPAKAAPAKRQAAYALYSDGSLAIARGVDDVHMLAPSETQGLIGYLVTQKDLVRKLFEGVDE